MFFIAHKVHQLYLHVQAFLRLNYDNSDDKKCMIEPSMVVHTCNPSTQETEARMFEASLSYKFNSRPVRNRARPCLKKEKWPGVLEHTYNSNTWVIQPAGSLLD